MLIIFLGVVKMFDTTEKDELGTTNNNNMANRPGMDEIDKWAMSIGQSERTLNNYRPKRKHLQTIE